MRRVEIREGRRLEIVLPLWFGRERITADREWLEVRRERFGIGRTRRFGIAAVQDFNLRDDEGGIVIGDGNERVRVGRRLWIVDALRVKMALQLHLGRVKR